MSNKIKWFSYLGFVGVLAGASCTENKTSSSEEIEISKMDSTSKVVKDAVDKLEEQTKKVESSIEKLDDEFKSNN